MPATSATRRGNGPGKGDGWGGKAKGEGKKPGNKDAGRPKRDVAALIQAAREERLAALKEHLLELAINADRQETQLAATTAYLDREEGKPVQRNEHSAPGGGPMVIERRIIDPARDRDPSGV